MTNRILASGNVGPANIKEGRSRSGRPRLINAKALTHFSPSAQAAREAARWEAEGFEKGSKEGQWTYTWADDFPVITLANDVRDVNGKIVRGIFAEYQADTLEVFAHNAHPANLTDQLDDMILAIMRNDADVVDSETRAADDFLETEGVTAVTQRETRFTRPLWHYRPAVGDLADRHNIDNDTAADMYRQRD